VTPRGTDWTLAALVAGLALTGALTLFGGPVVFALHDVVGFALIGALMYKFRRVWRRAFTRKAGAVALALVTATLATGIAWSSAIHPSLLGYNELAWHDLLGAALALAVLTHAFQRAKKPRTKDLTRRQLLTSAGVGVAALAAWRLAGAKRRYTGSFETGDDFPATSWVADAPAPLSDYALTVGDRTFTELDRGDELTATLDCTGGFYTTQTWRGTRLDRLIEGLPGDHVRVISVTGYRWSFSREEAQHLLLATHVSNAPLSHGHGAPVRLVAPDHRGFIWVKWVTRVELHDRPDPGAFISTLTSSL
jgi:hypothetical protein